MGRVFVSVLLLLGLAACGKADNAGDTRTAASKVAAGQPPAARPVEGPILGLMVAGSIDAKGNLTWQTFTFAPNRPQITVIARIGKVGDGASIRAWFQETDGDDKALFDQTVKVASFDRAYSEGKNSGVLAVGRYKVIATLDGKTREIEFAVASRSGKAAPRTVSDIGFDWLAMFGVHAAHAAGTSFEARPSDAADRDLQGGTLPASRRPMVSNANWQVAQNTSPSPPNQGAQAAPGNPPIPGASGAVHAPPTPSAPASNPPESMNFTFFGDAGVWDPEGNLLKLGNESIDRNGGLINFEVWGLYEELFSRLTTKMNGATVAIDGGLGQPHVYRSARYDIDPCTLPGNSDLPGTKINVTTTYSGSEIYKGVITLGEDTLAPGLKVDSTPPKGAKVKADQKIDIVVTAKEKRDDPAEFWSEAWPWQTGVRWIQVTSPEGLVGDSWTNPSKASKACASKTWEYTYKATYLVPKNPKLAILICAVTQDYAENENSKCATFFTGDIWSGTWHQDSNRSYKNFTTGAEVLKCNDSWDGTVSFAVGADGAVEGTAIAKLASGPACTPDRSSVVKVQEVAYKVIGHKTATGFELRFKFDHNTPIGSNMGGNVVLLGPHDCVGAKADPPPVLLDRTTADSVASGRFTATASPLCGGSAHDVLAVDAHLEVTRQ